MLGRQGKVDEAVAVLNRGHTATVLGGDAHILVGFFFRVAKAQSQLRAKQPSLAVATLTDTLQELKESTEVLAGQPRLALEVYGHTVKLLALLSLGHTEQAREVMGKVHGFMKEYNPTAVGAGGSESKSRGGSIPTSSHFDWLGNKKHLFVLIYLTSVMVTTASGRGGDIDKANSYVCSFSLVPSITYV
jgi:hypothetical protein